MIALAGAGFSAFYKRAQGITRRSATVLAIAVVGVLALLTWRQNGSYSDEIALYRATLDKNPDSWIAHYTLGFALVQTGQGDEIIKQFENALSLHPDFPEAHNGLARY